MIALLAGEMADLASFTLGLVGLGLVLGTVGCDFFLFNVYLLGQRHFGSKYKPEAQASEALATFPSLARRACIFQRIRTKWRCPATHLYLLRREFKNSERIVKLIL